MEDTRKSFRLGGKLSAVIRHFATVLALFGASAAFAAADCESHLESPLFRATRYFSYEELAQKSEDNLRAMLPGLDRILPVIQARRTALSQRVNGAWTEETLAELSRLEQDEKNIAQMTAAVSRAIARKHSQEKYAPAKTMIFDVNVANQTSLQVLSEIALLTRNLGGGNEHHVYRYFAAAREDLMRAYGTDLYGREFGTSDAWDEFQLEALLKQNGLEAEDGFYGVVYSAVILKTPKGEPMPFSMIEDFMRGDRALAIYDYNQLVDFDADFWVFKEPPKKKMALLAIIRPRK
jgi:hypothetical protein